MRDQLFERQPTVNHIGFVLTMLIIVAGVLIILLGK